MMSHSSGVSSLMLDIKYDFGLLGTPALVIVMQVKQNTLSHVLHVWCNRDSFMMRNCQCHASLLICVCVCFHLSFRCSLFACVCVSKNSSVRVSSQLKSYCI